jgi:pimeloyl-ACP methyl ester carboxylesterase
MRFIDTPDFTATFRHAKLPANGIVHHLVMGGSGPPVLLIHGWMGSWYHWRKVMPLLAKTHTVIAADARGYGDSDKPEAGYDGLTIVEDLRAIVQALGLGPLIVAGHDMGALPALLYAAHHPDEVRGLVYLDEPLPGYNLDRFTAFSKDNPFVYWWFAFNSQPHVPALMWSGKEDVLVDYFLSAMAADPSSISAEDKAEYVRGLRKPGGLHGSFGWYRDVLKTADQIVDATRTRLRVPVLAINGQYGHPGVAEQMRLVADDVRGITIPDCGHLPAEEQPQATAQAMLDFAAALTAT